MTGNEVIALVRENYGDADNNFLGTSALEDWVNEAVQQVYTLLPSGDMREVVNETSIALTTGRGDIPSTWDRIVSIYTADDAELVQMPPHFVNAAENLSAYFTPDVLGYAIDGNEIVVTDSAVASVTAQYLVQPDEITNFTSEISGIPIRYHYVVADWVTSLAYASEEDVEQATFYANRAQSAIAGRFPQEAMS